jgi:hypothetical protein
MSDLTGSSLLGSKQLLIDEIHALAKERYGAVPYYGFAIIQSRSIPRAPVITPKTYSASLMGLSYPEDPDDLDGPLRLETSLLTSGKCKSAIEALQKLLLCLKYKDF